MPQATRPQKRREAPSQNSDYSYDAAKRTEERRKAPITVWEGGDGVFHRRLKNNAVSRQAAALSREQQLVSRKIGALEAQMADLAPEQVEEWEVLSNDAAALEGSSIDLSYQIVALLLEDEQGQQPSVEDLGARVDIERIGELVRVLFGGGEPAEGPTPTPTI